MPNYFIIKIPTVKYKQAKTYQQQLYNNQGVKKPLWSCLIDTEFQKKQNDQFKDQMFKRFI